MCELHSDSQGFSLEYPASWLAGSTATPLWAVPRVADEGIKGLRRAGPGPQTHKVTSGATPSFGMARLPTWSVTPCPSYCKSPFLNVLHGHTILFSSFLLFPTNPSPLTLSCFACPLPLQHTSYQGLPATVFLFSFLPIHLKQTPVLLWDHFSSLALLEWGVSYM